MPIISIPAEQVSDVFARAGLAVLQRGANATLQFGWDSLPGMLTDEPADAMVGGAAVQSRRKQFAALAADVTAEMGAVEDGQACTVGGVAYRVVTPITRDVLGGWVIFLLERA